MDLESIHSYRAQFKTTERDMIMARVASHQKWAKRRFWLRLRAAIFGRSQSRVPANRSCQPARSSSEILRNVTSGTTNS